MADPYLSAQDVRDAVTGLSDPDKYPDATLERFVARFESLAESYRGVAFTPRSVTITTPVPWCGSASLSLTHPRVTEVTALSYDIGTAPAFGTVVITDGYKISLPGGAFWPEGTRVTVTYTHGYDSPPPAIIDGCIEFVRAEAIAQAGDQPRNTTGVRTDLGWEPAPLANIGTGAPTRWTVVNEALNQVPDERIPGIA